MKIQKVYQGAIPLNRISNQEDDSQINTYSTEYINKTFVTKEEMPDVIGTIIFEGQGSGNWLAQNTVYDFDLTPYKYLLVHVTAMGVNNPADRQGGNAVSQAIYIDLTLRTEYPICRVDGVDYHYGGTESHLDMQFFLGLTFDPGMFFSGVFVSDDKQKLYVGDAGYVVLGTTAPQVQYGSLYNGVSRIVGFR